MQFAGIAIGNIYVHATTTINFDWHYIISPCFLDAEL